MRSRRGIGVLAMCGLVLGIMAISASGAQAGMWMVNGSNVPEAKPLLVAFGAVVEELKIKDGKKHVVLLSTSGGNKVEILCGTVTVLHAEFLLFVLHMSLRYSSCITFINGKEEKACNPTNSPGIDVGLNAEVVLHEGKGYVKAEGIGGVFASLKFNEETCLALPAVIKLTGILWLEDCNNQLAVDQATHLIQEGEAPAKALGGLKFGANALKLDGSLNLTIQAPHTSWSGLPE